MQYILLIYSNEAAAAGRSQEESGRIFQEYMSFTEGIKKSGHYLSGEPLERATMATTVRVKDGKTLKTDGPFAETREQLGGFYIVEAKDLDEAIRWAKKIPSAEHGSVEVRPIWPMEEYMPSAGG